MKKKILIFTLLLNLAGGILWAAASPQEPLRIAYREFMPFYYTVPDDDHPRGILMDFWNLWSQKTGLPVSFHTMTWAEVPEQIRNGKIDINPGVFYSEERDKFLDFSEPFYKGSGHIFSHVSMPRADRIRELGGQIVGVVSGSFHAHLIAKYAPRATLREYSGFEELVIGAIRGDVKYILAEADVVMTYLKNHGSLGLFHLSERPVFSRPCMAAVREGRSELLKLVNQGIQAISKTETEQIVRKWTGEAFPQVPEQAEKLRISCPNKMSPFSFIDENGVLKGITIDIWRLWSEKTGHEIEFVPAEWQETLDMIKDGVADIHSGLFYSAERDIWLDFAMPINRTKVNFFFHRSIFGLKKLEDLMGFRIGVVRGTFNEQYIQKHLPGAALVKYATFPDLLDAAESGDIRVFVRSVESTRGFLEKRGLRDTFRFNENYPLYTRAFFAAVQSGNAELIESINQGMLMISPDERAELERKWLGASELRTGDTLIISLPVGNPPLFFLNTEGQPAGLIPDIWRLWAEKTGRKIEFRAANFRDTLDSLRNGEADIHAGLFKTDKRFQWTRFSQPIYEISVRSFFPTGGDKMEHLSKLSGENIGVLSGSYTQPYLQKNFPHVKIVEFEYPEDMPHAARNGVIRAFLWNTLSATHTLARLGLSGKFEYPRDPLFKKYVRAGVLKWNEDLLSLVDKGMNAISNQELAEIERRWVPDSKLRYYQSVSSKIRFTAGEERWLKQHWTIRLGVPPASPPFSFLGEGDVYKGICADYARLIAGRSGLYVQTFFSDGDEICPKLTSQEIDIFYEHTALACEARADFTVPLFSMPFAIINTNDTPFVGGVRDLEGKKVTVVRNLPSHTRLDEHYPRIRILPTGNALAGLRMVSEGLADAFVGSLTSAAYLIQKHHLVNLKIAAPADIGDKNVRIAVRQDWPELVGILNKVFSSISPEEHAGIFQKWVSLRHEGWMDAGIVWKWIFLIGGSLSVILGLVLTWNWRLAKEISQRKQTEDALRDAEEKWRSITENSPDHIMTLDPDGVVQFMNRGIAGMDSGQIVGISVFTQVSEHFIPAMRKCFAQVLDTGRPGRFEVEYERQGKKGRTFEARVGPVMRGGEVAALTVSATDVTEQREARERINAALREKEVLLREIHHRVKNNIQVISSLLRLQARSISDESVMEIFRESQSRVTSMALIHEILYRSDSLSELSLKDYVVRLTNHLFRAYALNVSLKLNIELDEIHLEIDQAVPCGLVLNELVSNALKHAFPDCTVGKIRIDIRMTPDDEIEIVVGDNGPGLPPGLDFRKARTLGLQLVRDLVRGQLHGHVELDNSDGAEFSIRFKPKFRKERI